MKAKNYCPEYEKYKTIRQWALLGQLPKKDAKGVELWANRNCQASYVYYSPDEVVPATEKELQDFFSLRGTEKISWQDLTASGVKKPRKRNAKRSRKRFLTKRLKLPYCLIES